MKRMIAIIGATEIPGKMLAGKLADTRAGLLLIAPKGGMLSSLKRKISEEHPQADIETMDCIKDGCWEADIIILTVPTAEIGRAVERMKEVATQKVVAIVGQRIDKNNFNIPLLLPHSRLVYVTWLASPDAPERDGTEEEASIIIEGTDEEANREIFDIFFRAGFQTIIRSISS
jgi:predicted dinucleotide-binding enzyme